MNINTFIEKSKKIHNNKYDYSLVEYKTSKTKVKIICTEHGIFEQNPNNHTNGQGCPTCGRENMKEKQKQKDFIKKAIKIHGDSFSYNDVKYINNRTNINITCHKCHNHFVQTPNNHLRYNKSCPYCSGEIFNKEIFTKNANNTHNQKYDYSLSQGKNNKSKIKIICPEHGIFEQRIDHHLNGSGCPKCTNKHNYSTKEWCKIATNKHNNKYNYSLVKYINAKTKIKLICPEHGIFEQIPSSHLDGRGCPKCKSSKGEEKIRKSLIENNINFESQKKFDNCFYKKKLYFDFYLPDYNLCIEFDGEQHFKSIPYWGGDEIFEKVKIRDKIKNQYCQDNNIDLLRIRFDEEYDFNQLIKKLLHE